MIDSIVPDNRQIDNHTPLGVSGAAPLGSIAENSSAAPNTPYHARWQLLKTARKLLPNERIASCQNYMAPDAGNVQIRIKEGKASYHNLIRCDSPSCPHCAAARAEQDRHELSVAIAQAKRLGYHVALVTATLRHNPTDSLMGLIRGLKTAWNDVFSGRFYTYLKSDWGMVGKVVALETTYGLNGWHPHLHALVFFDIPLSSTQIEHLRGLVADKWRYSLVKTGHDATFENGIDVRTAESDIAAYIAKYGREPREWSWGADSELARANQKLSSHEGLTPLELLGAASGHQGALQRFYEHIGGNSNPLVIAARGGHLWTEFYYATKGRARLHWGRMKQILGLAAALEQFDQDNPYQDDSYTMAVLPPESWWALKKLGLEAEALHQASLEQPDQFMAWCLDRWLFVYVPDIAYERKRLE